MRRHNDFVSPQVFNRMFTMHGTTMIFLWPCPSVRVCQLPRAIDDGARRHGVSPPEILQFLADRFRRIASLLLAS